MHHFQNNSGRDTSHRVSLLYELATNGETLHWRSDSGSQEILLALYVIMGFSAGLRHPCGSNQLSCDLAAQWRFAEILDPATWEPGVCVVRQFKMLPYNSYELILFPLDISTNSNGMYMCPVLFKCYLALNAP